jgi:predicted acetyltransferase
MAVTLERATADGAPVLSNLLELYSHDMSEIFRVELRPDGSVGYDKLPLYWSEPDTHFAFLIRSDARLAGFALVTRGSPASPDPDDLDVAEFFIARSFRRSGVGRQAAVLLWNQLPGQWVVRVSEANHAGTTFWTAAIRDRQRAHLSVSSPSLPGVGQDAGCI